MTTDTARQQGLTHDAESADSALFRARCEAFFEAYDATEDDIERGQLLKAWYAVSGGAHPVRPS